jgi:cytoskeletal protein CcmA (bactofilin family)
MKRRAVFALLLSVAGLGAVEINPWEFASDNALIGAAVRIDSTRQISDDLVAGGAFVEVAAPVPGDATLGGAHVRLFSDVGGNLTAAGAAVEISGEIKGKAYVTGASLHLDGTFNDSLVAGGAVIFLRGHVKGSVKLSGAEILIEDGAIIEDTLRYSAGRVHIAEGAVLKSGAREFVPEPKEKPEVEKKRPRRTFGRWLVGTIIGFLFFAGAGLFVSLVFPRHFKNVTGRVMVNPGLSALTGGIALLASPLVLFKLILLFASIVGIGAGLFVSAFYLTGIIFSIAYAGTAMGRWILSAARKGKEPHIILSMLLGTFIALVLFRIPYVGWVFRIAAFIFGFGALLVCLWLEIKPRTEKS